ncbi:MAG: hypothetical protein ACRBB3_01130 [Alphaproteobacteria bacterium]
MARVAGASQYLSQATLANKQGSTHSPSSLLSLTSSASILDAGRGNAVPGVGISARSRALNAAQIQSNSGSINELFSLSGGGSATVEAAQIQIAGLAATATKSRDVVTQEDGSFASNTIQVDDGSVATSSLGSEVDEIV